MAPVLCRNKLEICSRITKIFCACKFSVVGRLGFLGKACNSSRCVPALKETSLYSKFTLKYAAIATSPLFPVYPEICRNFYLFPISSLHRNMPQLLPLPYFQFTQKYAAIATSHLFPVYPEICRNCYLSPISSLPRNMQQLLPVPYFQFTIHISLPSHIV